MKTFQDFVTAPGSDDTATVINRQTTAFIAAQLLQMDNPDDLCFALTTLRTNNKRLCLGVPHNIYLHSLTHRRDCGQVVFMQKSC